MVEGDFVGAARAGEHSCHAACPCQAIPGAGTCVEPGVTQETLSPAVSAENKSAISPILPDDVLEKAVETAWQSYRAQWQDDPEMLADLDGMWSDARHERQRVRDRARFHIRAAAPVLVEHGRRQERQAIEAKLDQAWKHAHWPDNAEPGYTDGWLEATRYAYEALGMDEGPGPIEQAEARGAERVFAALSVHFAGHPDYDQTLAYFTERGLTKAGASDTDVDPIVAAEARGAAQERERIRAHLARERSQAIDDRDSAILDDRGPTAVVCGGRILGLDAALAVVGRAAPVSDGQGERTLLDLLDHLHGLGWLDTDREGSRAELVRQGLDPDLRLAGPAPDRVTVDREDLRLAMAPNPEPGCVAACERLIAALDREEATDAGA